VSISFTQSNSPPYSSGGKKIFPVIGTPFLCAASMTSALGGTMISSSEEPAQYTIRSTYCQLLNVFTKHSSSPSEGTPLVFEFNASNATSLILDGALSFNLYDSS